MSYQQPPPFVLQPNMVNGRFPPQGQQAPAYQSQMYPQPPQAPQGSQPLYPQPPHQPHHVHPQQPQHPQQPNPQQPNPQLELPSLAPARDRLFQPLRNKIALNYNAYRRTLLILGAVIFALCIFMEISVFDFRFLFLFLAVHFGCMACTIDTYRYSRPSMFGASIALQIVSIWRLASLIFSGFFAFFIIPVTFALQAWYIIIAVNMEAVATQKRFAASTAPEAASNEESASESDVVNDYNEQSYLPSQGNANHYSSVSEHYQQSHVSTPSQVQPPAQAPSLIGSADAQLINKYQVSLNLLQEMNFEKSANDRLRNARLLEKYAGNIQDVVTELLSAN